MIKAYRRLQMAVEELKKYAPWIKYEYDGSPRQGSILISPCSVYIYIEKFWHQVGGPEYGNRCETLKAV